MAKSQLETVYYVAYAAHGIEISPIEKNYPIPKAKTSQATTEEVTEEHIKTKLSYYHQGIVEDHDWVLRCSYVQGVHHHNCQAYNIKHVATLTKH